MLLVLDPGLESRVPGSLSASICPRSCSSHYTWLHFCWKQLPFLRWKCCVSKRFSWECSAPQNRRQHCPFRPEMPSASLCLRWLSTSAVPGISTGLFFQQIGSSRTLNNAKKSPVTSARSPSCSHATMSMEVTFHFLMPCLLLENLEVAVLSSDRRMRISWWW